MAPSRRVMLRAAERIRSHLERFAVAAEIAIPEADWVGCQTLLRRIRLAHRRGWDLAAARLRECIESTVARCAESFADLNRRLASAKRLMHPQSIQEIVQDFIPLSEEFDDFKIDMPNQTVSVTTEPIVLEETQLGPFEIRLHWERIGERPAYYVVALEPNPSRESEDTTHPHVKSDHLCEGEGQLPIDQALRSGRLLDFFQIVAGILRTYNSGSRLCSAGALGRKPLYGLRDDRLGWRLSLLRAMSGSFVRRLPEFLCAVRRFVLPCLCRCLPRLRRTDLSWLPADL